MPVVIFGDGITALGVLRSVARRGIPVFVAGNPGPLLRSSRYFRPVRWGPALGGAAADLAAVLEALPLERAVLLPCSDDWVRRLTSLPAALRDRFPAPVSDEIVVETLLDKGRLASTLHALGVPHPATWPLESPEAFLAIAPERWGRVFLKPLNSQGFFAHFGRKAVRPLSQDQALRTVAECNALGFAIQAQEYVPGPPTAHWFIDGYCRAGGNPVALFVRQRLRMYPADFGNSTAMRSTSPESAAPAVAALKTLLKQLAYRGVFSAEFKQSSEDGSYYLIEVNARPWWYVEFAARCGVDVCFEAYRDVLGQPPGPNRPYRVGKRCVYPYYDRHALLEQPRPRAFSLLQWGMAAIGAWQPVFRFADPVPALQELAGRVRDKWRKSFGPPPRQQA